TAEFLIRQLGFTEVEVRYQAPFPPEERLPRPPLGPSADEVEARLDALTARLNDLLYGDRDYLLIARRASGYAAFGGGGRPARRHPPETGAAEPGAARQTPTGYL